MKKSQEIRIILNLLNAAYGRRSLLRKSNPIDELVRTILSQNTTDKNSLKAFAVLKKRFRAWDHLLKAETRRIASLIRHAGLANIKTRRIKEALAEIKRREGRLSLVRLRRLETEKALNYLKSLKGVGPKTAACVLLFSFGKPVMPVDTHIFRVTKRLGLIGKNIDIKEAHKILSRIVPKGLIYPFHSGIIEHGRKVCIAHNPRCGGPCVLYKVCRFEKKTSFRRRGPD